MQLYINLICILMQKTVEYCITLNDYSQILLLLALNVKSQIITNFELMLSNKYCYNFLKTRLSEWFESYFIKSIYEVTFKLPRQSGFQKNAKVFNYINLGLIRQQNIKRMVVLKKLTHPNASTLYKRK